MRTKASPARRKRRIALVAVLLVLALALGLFLWYVSDYYHADASAQAALEPVPGVTVIHSRGLVVFQPRDPAAGLVFYPGGKVEYTAYAPLMQELAQQGVLCVLVEMPCNLAVLDADAADRLDAWYPKADRWFIGGHSLGGAMAAGYYSRHTDTLDGLILLGAYSTADLTDCGGTVVSVYGSEDGVLDLDKYQALRSNLPEDLRELVLQGGNHAQFGAYGAQAGDGQADLTPQEQREQTAQAVLAAISG